MAAAKHKGNGGLAEGGDHLRYGKARFHIAAHGIQKDKKTFYEPDVPTVPLKLAGELRTEDNDKLHRILIVEDNDELRSYLFQSFSPIYNVQVCNNGKEALTIVKQFWPELILSDIMMPEMRGDELCIAIKNDIETSHIPVVLLLSLIHI